MAEGNGNAMKRRLGRLLQPGMGMYFFVMAAFCAAALLEEHYWLAAAETSMTLLMFMLYMVNRHYRDQLGIYEPTYIKS